jgi:hypothetical protein
MAGKRKKQRGWKKLQQSVLFRLRNELEYLDVRVMSNIMAIILLVCIIAATVAWFSNSQSAAVRGVNMTSAEVADIEVSLTKEPWEDIYTAAAEATGTDGMAAGNEKQITMKMPAFSNIYDTNGQPVTRENSDILAPGAYGTLTFYVKSVNKDCKACRIYIDKAYKISGENTSDNIKSEISSIMQGHILCFGKRTETDGKYQYSNYLSEDVPITLNLDYDTPEEVTIYWVWPYEYTDLLKDCSVDSTGKALFQMTTDDDSLKSVTDLSDFTENSDYVLKMRQVYCWEKFSAELDRYLKAEKDGTKRGEYLEDWYDYADTMIGNYVTDLSYKITVKGVMSDGK